MDLVFVNGSDVQKAACRTAAHNLLNLPFDSIALKHTVEFIDDPLPSSHNEFAITEWTYDSTEALTKIASIAPDWPEPWKGMKFLQEVYAHELGHGLFAALPEWGRVAVAEMFGAESDDIEELQPEGSAWVNRFMEGIAETFKDAFLPRSLRLYPNRTNRNIPYHKFPEFRAIWREAVPEISSGATVPAYDLDVFKRGGSKGSGLHDTGSSATFSLQAPGAVEVRGGLPMKFSWDLPLAVFSDMLVPEFPNQEEIEEYFGNGAGSGSFVWVADRWHTFTFEFEAFIGAEVFAEWTVFIKAMWIREDQLPAEPFYTRIIKPTFGGLKPAYLVWSFKDGEGEPGEPTVSGGPGSETLHFEWSFTTPWEKAVLKLLQIKGKRSDNTTGRNVTEPLNPVVMASIPEFRLKQAGAIPGEGEPIVLPSSDIGSAGLVGSGRRPKNPMIVGRNW